MTAVWADLLDLEEGKFTAGLPLFGRSAGAKGLCAASAGETLFRRMHDHVNSTDTTGQQRRNEENPGPDRVDE
jgi:hypothetical protein